MLGLCAPSTTRTHDVMSSGSGPDEWLDRTLKASASSTVPSLKPRTHRFNCTTALLPINVQCRLQGRPMTMAMSVRAAS